MHSRLELLEFKLLFRSIRVWIDSDWEFNSDSFGLMPRIEEELIGSSRIDFWPFFIKRDRKRCSYWFGIISNGL